MLFCGLEEGLEGGGGEGKVERLRVRRMSQAPEGLYFFLGEGGDLGEIEEGV